jgi:crossover junction endodeoxyribonuclease RuvC
VKIFGIDPGSVRTGFGCVERVGSRHALVVCGSLSGPPRATFPDRLKVIHAGLAALLAEHRPDCVAIEDIFHSTNARSALKLGQARGVALLAASEAGVPVAEYAPAAV